jgi:hypothetical protein
MHPLRLMVYDATCTTHRVAEGWDSPIGLTHTWIAGARLYGALGRFDAWAPATSWAEALDWLGTVHPERPIAAIQYWGHGQRGLARVDRDVLDESALRPGHALHGRLQRIRERMIPDGLWWFRTCDTFGAVKGQSFARRWTDFFGCSAAGHTHVIGPWQSGLHRLVPGVAPRWSPAEGVAGGTPEAPTKSAWSAPWLPHTVTCLAGGFPVDW